MRLRPGGFTSHCASRGLLCLLPLACLLAGCANTGAPKPPSLHLPKQPAHLAATRTGDDVTLTWETPTETTDSDTLRGPVNAQICRAEAAVAPCRTLERLPVKPGSGQAVDHLAPSLASGAAALLAYRVELFNGNNRSAGPSDPVFVASGAAPAPAGPLAAAARRNGVLVTWQRQADPDSIVELHRALPAAPGRPLAARPSRARTSPATQSSAANVILRPDVPPSDTDKATSDAGGLVDRTLHDGDTPTYTAQRVRTVRLLAPVEPKTTASPKKGAKPHEPKAALQDFEIRGIASPPLTFAFHDTLPPASPTGLATIASSQPSSIDLSWDAAPEADVTGYNIYRAEPGSDQFRRLNPTPINGPGYRDLSAQPARLYLYRVTAVDARGNESAPTPSAQEQIRP